MGFGKRGIEDEGGEIVQFSFLLLIILTNSILTAKQFFPDL